MIRTLNDLRAEHGTRPTPFTEYGAGGVIRTGTFEMDAAPYELQKEITAGQQEWVNRLYARHGVAVATRAAKLIARTENKRYRQYDHMWDDWTLFCVRRDLSTKGGMRARRDDIVIATTRRRGGDDLPTFYSVRGHINCAIRPEDLIPCQ
jgi:hypothetical protein